METTLIILSIVIIIWLYIKFQKFLEEIFNN
jgi:hypothetical protein